VAATTIIGCGSQAPSNAGTDTPAAETKTEEAKTEEKAADTTAEASGDKVTLSIYTQYADDDTKVPYDYAVEQLAEAYPNVELNLIVQAQDDGQTLKTLPLGVLFFQGEITTDWGGMGATMVIASFPAIIVYSIFSEQVESAMTIGGAVKG
jgi:hypothetical protein